MSSSPFAAAAPEVLAEIIREAELRLSAQLTAAVAADQRAMTFAGLLLAAAGALIGAALGADPGADLTVPVFVTALGLFISSILAVISARPVPWDWPGNEPCQWLTDIEHKTDLHQSTAAMAAFYDEMIKENEAAIGRAAFWIRLSMTSALLSLLLGLTAAAIRVL